MIDDCHNASTVPQDEPTGATGATIDLIFIADELVMLADRLREIFRAPYPKDRDPIWCQQQQYTIALLRLAKFFKLSAVGNDVAGKLAELGDMLYGLQYGQQNPLLMPQNFGNRPHTRSDISLVRARAVNGLDFLICSGMKLKKAAILAAKEAPNLDRALENKADLVSSLISWRRTFKTGKVSRSSPSAQRAYDENQGFLLLAVDQFSPAKLREAGLKLLQNVDHAALDLVFDAAK